ncbi:transmembrane protein 140 [Bufo gargarizans]|uniref:transmembrane protein 140 n=1 Tax=Bufo gargarizans TaxID=30331 RepID=UPI001CF28090|nr:transmembrane protein 140 [Bufo gargarizans]
MLRWQKTCLSLQGLGYTIVLLQSLVWLLLVYALIIGGGNVLVDGCKKIGFYNYCFHNTTNDDDCHCITHFSDLNSKITSHGLTLSLILTYSSLVIVVMGLVNLALAQWLKDDTLWNFQLGLNILSLVGLFLGTISHLFLTLDQFDLSRVTLGFLALQLAVGGLFLQICLIRIYIRLNSVLSTSKTGGHAA